VSAGTTADVRLARSRAATSAARTDVWQLSQEDHRRLDGVGECKLAPEVASVGGDEYRSVDGCLGEHVPVASAGHAMVAYVARVVPSCDQ